MAAIDIRSLLAKTRAFLNTMYAVQESFDLGPADKKHIGTCINYADLLEMRDDFVHELVNTAVTFVYSPAKQQELQQAFVQEGRDSGSAWSELIRRTKAKFRPSSLQGQFSELLLCNLLQHYFHAAPLVRKMPITTNPALERNGADAIHISRQDTGYRLYLGEAKTYAREAGGPRDAITAAITDVLEKYEKHRSELDLYTYEDFVPPELEEIARKYQSGELPEAEVHLVCIVTFDENDRVLGANRQQKLDHIMQSLRESVKNACNTKAFKLIPDELRPRMNFILFPVREMKKAAFEKELS